MIKRSGSGTRGRSQTPSEKVSGATAIGKVLVVDDSPINVAIVKKMLGNDYWVQTAASGEEALEIAPRFRPDIILLDIMMPGIDGYEVCRRIRADAGLRHAKIIMVSAKAMLSERLEGYAVGADDYVTKPFEHDELLAKVRVYLRLKSVEEIEQLKSGVLTLLGYEMSARINSILLPTTLLISDEDMPTLERKMLAEMVYRNIKRLHGLLEDIAGSPDHGDRSDGAAKASAPDQGERSA